MLRQDLSDLLCETVSLQDNDDDPKADSELMFSFICDLAIKKDKEKLSTAQRALISLNMLNGKELLTPVAWLASHGKHDAVKFLIEELNVDASSAAASYAKLGDKARVENLIALYHINLSVVAAGYERGKYFVEVDDLLKRGACIDDVIIQSARLNRVNRVNDLLKRGAHPDSAAFGYIRGKHFAAALLIENSKLNLEDTASALAQKGLYLQVDELLECALKNSPFRTSILNGAGYGYALTGDIKRAGEMLDQGADKSDVIYGFAKGGYVVEARELLNNDITFHRAINEDVNNSLHAKYRLSAIEGFAAGGHTNIVMQMLADVAQMSVNKAVYSSCQYTAAAAKGFAMADDVVNVKKIVKLDVTSTNAALIGYACGGHLESADKMLSKSRDIHRWQVQMVVDGYREGKHFAAFSKHDTSLNILSRVNDKELRVALVNEAVNLGYVKRDAVKGLLKEAEVENKKIRDDYSKAHPSKLSIARHKLCSLFHHNTENVTNIPVVDEVRVDKKAQI